MIPWLVLLIVAIARTQAMRCANQDATHATCTMQPLGNNGQATIHLMQPASCYGYDDPMMITVNMQGYSTPQGRPAQPHRMMVMQYGDISGGCQNAGMVFNPDVFHGGAEKKRNLHGSTKPKQPIGVLGSFSEPNGKPYSFQTKNGAMLTGDNSIIGRALVMYEGSGQNPVGCCVIGRALDPNAGQRGALPPHQGAFGLMHMDRPLTSGSIFGNHPFFAGQDKGISFGSQNNPKASTGVFDLSFNDFSNLGSHPFGKNDFGGVLTPSLHHLDKPPSPPQFPGRKGFLGKSPLFGSTNPTSKNSANAAFGVGFNSIPSFSQEETFIPTDGDEQPVPGSNDNNDPRPSQSQNQDRGQSQGQDYQGDNTQQGQGAGYQEEPGRGDVSGDGRQGQYDGSQGSNAGTSNADYQGGNTGYQGGPAAGQVNNAGYQEGNNGGAPSNDVRNTGYQGGNAGPAPGDISNTGYQGGNAGPPAGIAVGEYHPNAGQNQGGGYSDNQNGGQQVPIATNPGTVTGYQGGNTGTGTVYPGDSSPPNAGVNTYGSPAGSAQTGNAIPLQNPDLSNTYQPAIVPTPYPSPPSVGSARQPQLYPTSSGQGSISGGAQQPLAPNSYIPDQGQISGGAQQPSQPNSYIPDQGQISGGAPQPSQPNSYIPDQGQIAGGAPQPSQPNSYIPDQGQISGGAPQPSQPNSYIPASTNNSPSNAYPSSNQGSSYGSYSANDPKYIETPQYNSPQPIPNQATIV